MRRIHTYSILFFITIFLSITTQIKAFEKNTFVSVVNPVTGMEGWTGGEQTPLDMPQFQYQEATKSALPVTWLLRFDIVNDATFSANFKQLIVTDSSQTLGGFMEVTPKLAELAKVVYPDGDYISQPHRVFLSGYTQEDRLKLIDTFMNSFFDVYGFYPKSVGAWYIDSFSLKYMSEKYSVLAAVLCDEQYTTDHYRLWGAYLGSPYFPSITNSMVPANSSKNRINIAITKWAMRDPYNFYGTAGASSFSIQINDYLFHNQNTEYFDRLLSIYSDKKFNDFSQVVIGLENSYPLKQYRQEIKNVYKLLRQREGQYNLKFVQLDQFGDWLKARYPESSPAFLYKAKNPTGSSNGEVLWYQTPFYRVGIKKSDNKTQIIDFRLYHQNEAEPYYLSPNTDKTLYAENPSIVDSVKYKNTEIDLDFNLNINNLQYIKDSWIVSATDSAKTLTLHPKKIIFDNFSSPTIKNEEIKVINEKKRTIWSLNQKIPFNDFTDNLLLNLLKIILISAIIIFITKKIVRRPSISIILTALLISPIVLITVFKSGLTFPFGLGFWGPNGHDAIFHLSLINSFSQSLLDFNNPQFSGLKLQNYHFGFDYLAAIISQIFGVTILDTYFRFLPIIITILIIIFSIKLTSIWKYGQKTKILSLILIFLTGSIGFIPKVISDQNIFSGESVFWANQSISLLLNPPFTLSLIFLLIFLVIFEKTDKKSLKNLLILGIIGGLLAQIKIYAFILICFSLLLRRHLRYLISVGVFGLIFISPSLGISSSPFVFRPLWFPETMIASPDRLNLRFLAEAWQVYQNQGQFIKLILINLFALAIFLVGNLGIRLIGLFRIVKNCPTAKSQQLAQTIVILGLIIPLLFIQQQNPWNTIQFSYYSLFFLGFFTAEELTIRLGKTKKTISIAIILIFFILAIPTTIGTIKDYLSKKSSSRISFVELRALSTLSKQPSGVVISSPFKSFLKIRVYDPRPLYAYTSTAYISAFSGQKEFLSDTINLEITGFNYQERLKLAERLFNTKDEIWVKNFLKDNQIKYIYETPINKLKFNPESINGIKIFDSGEINIYKFNIND